MISNPLSSWYFSKKINVNIKEVFEKQKLWDVLVDIFCQKSQVPKHGEVCNVTFREKIPNPKKHHTVDGRTPAPVEVGSLSHDLRQVFLHPRWLYRISSINTIIRYNSQYMYLLYSWWLNHPFEKEKTCYSSWQSLP